MSRILVIDDETSIVSMLERFFQRLEHEVVTAANGEEGLRSFSTQPADLVITDILMPHKEGFETIRELRAISPDVKIVAISGGGRNESATYLQFAQTFGADRSLSKPLKLAELEQIINELLESKESSR